MLTKPQESLNYKDIQEHLVKQKQTSCGTRRHTTENTSEKENRDEADCDSIVVLRLSKSPHSAAAPTL